MERTPLGFDKDRDITTGEELKIHERFTESQDKTREETDFNIHVQEAIDKANSHSLNVKILKCNEFNLRKGVFDNIRKTVNLKTATWLAIGFVASALFANAFMKAGQHESEQRAKVGQTISKEIEANRWQDKAVEELRKQKDPQSLAMENAIQQMEKESGEYNENMRKHIEAQDYTNLAILEDK